MPEPQCRLGDISKINPESLGVGTPSDYTFRYIDISSVSEGVIDWSTVRSYQFSEAPSRARRIVRQNDVLICTVRPGLQAHCYIDKPEYAEQVASTGFAVVRCGAELNPRFLFHSLFGSDIPQQLRIKETGSNYPAVNEGDIQELLILCPDVEIQKKISRILDTLDDAIQKTEQLIAKLKAIKQGLLHDLLTRGLDENGQLRPIYNNAPQQYKYTELGWVPKDWVVLRLGSLANVTKLAGFEYTNFFDYSKKGPIIAIRGVNIKEGKLDLTDIHTIPQETSELLKRSKLFQGDIIISYVGTLGQVAVIPIDNKFHLAPNVAKISVNKDLINPYYLNQYLNYSEGQKEIFKWAGSTTQSALSMQNLRQILIKKPSKAEQDAIYSVLDSFDQFILRENDFYKKLKLLKKGLMHDLLTGKVRVNIKEVNLDQVKGESLYDQNPAERRLS